MTLLNKIEEAYSSFTTYPQLAQRLIAAGVHSYTVDVATAIIVYRTASGENAIHQNTNKPRIVAETFNKEQVIQVIRINQAGNSTYAEFMEGIANAGVRFYEAMFFGDNKRVTYIGIGDSYEEKIPI